jgi:prepilin-type N-terminal cleavage/methylation domain-containing protein
MHSPKRHSAFSLVELMIALVVMAVVVTRVMVAFTEQHENSIEQERVVDTQQGMRLVMDVILEDLRMAGFMVQRETAVGSTDGGTSGSDVLCMSDPRVLAPSAYQNSNDRFDSAEVTTLITGGNSSITLAAGELDIDGDGNDDFIQDNGVLISDGNNVHCALVTGITGTTLDLSPSIPGGVSMSASTVAAAPALYYQLASNQLTRNGMVIATDVDDLQVEFGVDADRDGEIEPADGEFPIHNLNGSDTSRIRSARVHLTMRTAVAESDFSGQRAGAANRVAASSTDNFRRRKAIADAHLRNLR